MKVQHILAAALVGGAMMIPVWAAPTDSLVGIIQTQKKAF